MKKLAVVVSIPPEFKLIKKLIKESKGTLGGVDIDLGQCQMGEGSALEFCEKFLNPEIHCGVLVLGFCGGLSLRLKVGDVIIPHKIMSWENTNTFELDLGLIENLGRALLSEGFNYKSVPLITENHVVQTSKERMKIFKESHAEAVDMESSAIVEMARKKRLPVAVIKTVIDDFENDLPDFNAYLSKPGGLMAEDVGELLSKDSQKGSAFSKNLKKGGVKLTEIAPLVTSFVQSYWSKNC